jgi:cell wall-associated NlpC family hydrolase
VIDFICQVLKNLLNEKNMTNKESLMMFFQSVLGTPYKWGGNNCLEGYDCSGFVQDALSVIGVDPPGDQTSNDLYNFFKDIQELNPKDISFGCLLFFGKEKVTHVAIALNQKQMIEAGGGGSKTTTFQDAMKTNACVRIRPISRRNDLLHVIKIKEFDV